MEEIWREVSGTDGRYYVSNIGRIKSDVSKFKKKYKKRVGEYIMNPMDNPGGYKMVSIDRKLIMVHRLVASAFIHNVDNKPFVNHIDGNKLNNYATNLEWVTKKENNKHASDICINAHGETHAGHKISEIQAIEIFFRYRMGDSRMGLAKEYGISPPQVSLIARKKSWKYLWRGERSLI